MNDKFNDYKLADLNQNDYNCLVDKESKLNNETGKKYILVAYEKK